MQGLYNVISSLIVSVAEHQVYNWHQRTYRTPSKHEALAQCWVAVVPASWTMGQRQPDIWPTPRVCWDTTPTCRPTEK